mmetsp:Transcript_24171/g.31565  ORF Transcript_24171/g.31565 Transcript_24171/m.31565 type:complete len:830 (+) Transcript_24171:20-2509(+)|eukprot:CAMPEP_0117782784 /NCGR_PEP_ID=MMETSP0948-20121206/3640_1 /TAXON_ID=44440 /ORGANISM="Chattonella subsalsa, Strain CCMP2191" /LENGTH=829 /DNA_ID=CAMNT_0005611057 /DNA_START=88 /DNA_END=2577 /DNA_ORIENTATION=-
MRSSNGPNSVVIALKKLMSIVKSRHPNTKVINLFPDFKKYGEKAITKTVFANALCSLQSFDGTLEHITTKEAISLFEYIDANNTGFITFEHLMTTLKRFHRFLKNGDNVELKFQKDEVFPMWLTDRSDFQKVFPRFALVEKPDENAVLKAAFATKVWSRSYEQQRIIAEWIGEHPNLKQHGTKRAWKLAKVLEYTTLPAKARLFSQGDWGDSFYVVLSGEVAIIVDGQQVCAFGAGKTFGEQALENQCPRAATVEAITPCEFLRLTASGYTKIMVNERQQKLHDTADFLRNVWRSGKYKNTHKSKIVNMATIIHRRKCAKNEVIFDQGDEPSVFYIILSGSAELRKVVKLRATNSWPIGKANSDKAEQVTSIEKFVHLKNLWVGDDFGEDTLFDFTERQYRAIAKEDNTNLYIINRRDIKHFLTRGEQQAIFDESEYLYTSVDDVKDLYEADQQHRKNIKAMKLSTLGPSYLRRKNTTQMPSNFSQTEFSLSLISKKDQRNEGIILPDSAKLLISDNDDTVALSSLIGSPKLRARYHEYLVSPSVSEITYHTPNMNLTSFTFSSMQGNEFSEAFPITNVENHKNTNAALNDLPFKRNSQNRLFKSSSCDAFENQEALPHLKYTFSTSLPSKGRMFTEITKDSKNMPLYEKAGPKPKLTVFFDSANTEVEHEPTKQSLVKGNMASDPKDKESFPLESEPKLRSNTYLKSAKLEQKRDTLAESMELAQKSIQTKICRSLSSNHFRPPSIQQFSPKSSERRVGSLYPNSLPGSPVPVKKVDKIQQIKSPQGKKVPLSSTEEEKCITRQQQQKSGKDSGSYIKEPDAFRVLLV